IKTNVEVGIFTLHTPNMDLYSDEPEIVIESLNASRELQSKKETNIGKLIYFKSFHEVRKVIKKFNPDIVHSHYASSYGLVGALSNFHPYLISVWGSDIYSFPRYSNIYKKVLNYSLNKADLILATSNSLMLETKKYCNKTIDLIPFGIDTSKFVSKRFDSLFSTDDIVIGTIKTLEKNYRIEYLIKAFHILSAKYSNISLKLLIVGKGTQREVLEKLVQKLGIKDKTIFAGFIHPDDIPKYHNMLDIFVAVSEEESFGVAVLESCACEKPVVVSNVGGFPEVVTNNETGLIVEKNNIISIVNSLEKLILNPDLRKRMGKNGRQKVISQYDWEESVKKMLTVYRSFTYE
ncbi:MAG: glycosyltransferase, partial [Ignavibacteriaceae bacterium]|nr:glycosyltransferase [Ignavibacteriaceae bacterium]